MITIVVNGAKGQMGQQTVTTVARTPDFQLLAGLVKGDSLQASIEQLQPDVVIDFTRADVAYDNASTIIDSGVRAVIGTSGLSSNEINTLTARCEKRALGAIIAPNFSVGAVLMMLFARQAIRYLPQAEIIEMHHEHKQDAPSATALKTAELMEKNAKSPVHSKELLSGCRGAEHSRIPIHSVRLPGLLAYQKVLFGGTGETLSITHNSLNRECFMPGVVLACRKVMTLNTLVYGLENLLLDDLSCH